MSTSPELTEHCDVTFAVAGGRDLLADIYVPPGDAPTVLYFHGGGFAHGDKQTDLQRRLRPLARAGLGLVAVGYRLAPQARYPDTIHDAKAAVRFVRAEGRRFGLATDRIGVLGASAGGYIAAMLAFTAGDEELEGALGDHGQESSTVDAACLWSAPLDLRANAHRSPLEQRLLPVPFEGALVGSDDLTGFADRLASISPLRWITADAPPVLLVHGDLDRVVPSEQSRLAQDALTRAGVACSRVVIGGAGHEDPQLDDAAHLTMVAAWLRANL